MLRIAAKNMLVLSLHALACVAGFIAGGSLALKTRRRTGIIGMPNERARHFAIAFVICATTFSLVVQAYVLGAGIAQAAHALHSTSGWLLVGLLPHALPELVALFLPLAAWIVAARSDRWDELLAATLVTVAIAIPILVLTALWEVYVAPNVLGALFHYVPRLGFQA